MQPRSRQRFSGAAFKYILAQRQAAAGGWAGDSDAKSVAPSLQIVLEGNSDYALSVPTGYPPRADVAKFKDIPAFANAGYAVNADLSAVQPGQYAVVLRYSIGGQTVGCDTHRQFVVQ
ncbi:MAG: hypothetical protein C4338_06440, partial [Rhodanobacteraceae bacterium]